ncbi:hypothetical protein [Bifidobacterium polysaccharolyticum]|uniref:hypothetical protein n=1 Tax=Bifidobacterium polysaccharolyticum TaxID=2750967 RepID=UPI0021BAED92|nr:hypothetical protein [Bifidobacterium polysaccharolyticum]MCT8157695.1 hypothetical protein [Bifidobacterium polysaccharolyticum]
MGHNSSTKKRHPKHVKGPKPEKVPKYEVPKYVQAGSISKTKVPKAEIDNIDELNEMKIIFRFDLVDLEPDCPWSLAKMSESDHAEFLKKLKQFEYSKVGELKSPRLGSFKTYHDFSKCPNQDPVERLGKYYEFEGDSIARFRLSGKKRLYGFLIDNGFHIVWWDPEHEIWPSKKKHT